MQKRGYVIIIVIVLLLSSAALMLSLSINADASTQGLVEAVDERRLFVREASASTEQGLDEQKMYERMDRQAQRIENQQQRIIEGLRALEKR